MLDFIAGLAAAHPEDAEDLAEAAEVLSRQKISSVARLVKLSDSQWQRLNLPLGIEALLREAAAEALVDPPGAVDDSATSTAPATPGTATTCPDAGRTADDPALHSSTVCTSRRVPIRAGSHVAMLRFLVTVVSSALAEDASCWDGDFTPEVCCNPKFGPRGHEECWDTVHTFERCCPEDCRTSDTFDFEGCCDLVSSDQGKEACWVGGRSFRSCCLESAPERRPQLAGPDFALEALPVFGEGCWVPSELLTFARCCGTAGVKEHCWIGDFTYTRCCLGLHSIPRIYLDLPKTDLRVHCLQQGLEAVSDRKTLGECLESGGRYIHVSAVLYRLAEMEVMHEFWWNRPSGEALLIEEVFGAKGRQVSSPEWLHPSGSLCVPAVCSEEAIAGWFAGIVDIGQRYIRPSYKELNATHVRTSPLPARRRPYPRFEGSWIMYRPGADRELRKQQDLQSYYEFVLTEHKPWRQLGVSRRTWGVLLGLVVPVAFASLLYLCGVQDAKPLALQSNLWRLGEARAKCFDVCRIVTTVGIIATHVKHHYPFPAPEEGDGVFRYLANVIEALHVNHLVVMLMVYLLLRHLDEGRRDLLCRGPFSWLWRVATYALRRWALIMSWAGLWLYIYVSVLIKEVPIPNIGKSRFLYIWFWRMRISCEKKEHLIPSIFLLHEASHAYESPCHNLNIFEACFQLDVLLMALLLILPKRGRTLLAAGLWMPAAWCHTGKIDDDGLYHSRPRMLEYLPAGLATIALYGLLPKPAADAWRLRVLLWLLTISLFGATVMLNLFFEQLEFLRNALPRLGVAPAELLALPELGTALLALKLLETGTTKGEAWSPVSALGRLAAGMNLSHLFVLQLHRGFSATTDGISSDDIILPASPSLFLSLVVMIFLVSAGLSAVVFLFIEAPLQSLLHNSAPAERAQRAQPAQPAPEPPEPAVPEPAPDASNGHTNGRH
ncbi:unnamed protein product [Effrenium voratum]|nr:unnamed protein product [Effrenium voratum]